MANLSQIVINYNQMVDRLIERLLVEDARLVASYLGLSLSNYYSKRCRERQFTYADIEQLVNRFGSEADLADYKQFTTVRYSLYGRLENLPIPLTEYRRILNIQHIHSLDRRRDHPDTWTIGDLKKIGAFFDKIASAIEF